MNEEAFEKTCKTCQWLESYDYGKFCGAAAANIGKNRTKVLAFKIGKAKTFKYNECFKVPENCPYHLEQLIWNPPIQIEQD